MLSSEDLSRLKQQDDTDLFELASALLSVQEAILRMEEHTDDPDLLRTLSARALESGKELSSVLAAIEATIEDE
ncbi:MAG TPA: hypothetical protein VKK79_03800 [Candidatus Lokiarchaeia archaeon]|nr:hypothetical protein [Candidatus Lokiarchaeia archaeon]